LTIDVDTPRVHIYPVSDVQIGAVGVAKEEFREHIEEAIADPFGRLIGIGDYTDSVSPSNRRVLNANFERGDLYDTPRAMIDDAAKRYADEFLGLVEGTEGRWDALLKGHHLHEYLVTNPDGTKSLRTTDHDIADAVGAPYLGEPGQTIGSAMIKYRFPATHKGGKRPVLKVYAVHGQGGGGSWSAPFGQLEKMMRAFTAHIYIVAHHHKDGAVAATKLDEDAKAPTLLKATDARLVAAGSWMRSYMPDTVTYAEDGMLVPLAVGAPIIFATPGTRRTFKIRALV
jgi:hypothetical protein